MSSSDSDVYAKIENKIKKKKLNQSYTKVLDKYSVIKTCPMVCTIEYDGVYDKSGKCLLKIDYKSIINNSIYNKSYDNTSNNTKDITYTSFLPFSILDNTNDCLNKKFIQQNIKLIENIINTSNLQNTLNTEESNLWLTLLQNLDTFVLNHLTYSGSNIEYSIQILPHINITSPSLLIYLSQNDLTLKTFYKLYSKIANNISSPGLIKLIKLQGKDIDTFKIKEILKIYRLCNLKYSDKFINAYNSLLKSTIISARVLYYMKRYTDALLILGNTKTILRYRIIYRINSTSCIQQLKNDLVTYKHYLMYISFIKDKCCTKLALYKICIKEYDNEHTSVEYIRYIFELLYNNTACSLCTKTIDDVIFNINDFINKFNNDILYYECFLIKKNKNQQSYKFLSKCKKKLIKKNVPYDLLEQEMCYIENKECKNNKYYYLYYYKVLKKSKQKDTKIFWDGLKKNNGDCLIILYIFGININYLEWLYSIYNIRGGYYWCRVRHVEVFVDRLNEGRRMLEMNQNYT